MKGVFKHQDKKGNSNKSLVHLQMFSLKFNKYEYILRTWSLILTLVVLLFRRKKKKYHGPLTALQIKDLSFGSSHQIRLSRTAELTYVLQNSSGSIRYFTVRNIIVLCGLQT